jgi:hypothetical protein
MPGSAAPGHLHSERDQFVRMTRNFFARFFESDLISPQADFSATFSQALGLLAAPGLFVPLLLLPLLMMDAEAARSWKIKLIFVFFSAVVMGVLSILEWDALMLDHRDQAILMALPVRPRTIFASKFAALALFLVIFSVDVNVGSILLLPPLEMMGKPGGAGLLELVRYTGAHAAATIGASAFIYLLVVSVQGMLINTFKPKWYRRISTGIQVIAILGFLAALFFAPAIIDIMEQMPSWKLEGTFVRWFPPIWFVGLCEVLQGTADAGFRSLARTALYALGAAGGCSVAAYAIAYGRYTRVTLEGAVNAAQRASRPRSMMRVAGSLVVRRFVGKPVEHGIFLFTVQTMFRSSKHRLIMAAYVGTGLALVLEEIGALTFQNGRAWKPAQEAAVLSLPLVISFFLLSGMRFIFNIPSELSANWIFQLTERGEKEVYLSGVRKCMLLVVVAPLAAVVLLAYSVVFGPETAAAHAIYCSLLSLLMMEALLWRLDKLPFACSYVPGKIPVVALLVVYWMAFMAYTHAMAFVEQAMLRSRLGTAACLSTILSVWVVLLVYRKRAREEGVALVFHEDPEPVVRTLNLSA